MRVTEHKFLQPPICANEIFLNPKHHSKVLNNRILISLTQAQVHHSPIADPLLGIQNSCQAGHLYTVLIPSTRQCHWYDWFPPTSFPRPPMADPLLGRNPGLVLAGPAIHCVDPLDATMPLVQLVSPYKLSPSCY